MSTYFPKERVIHPPEESNTIHRFYFKDYDLPNLDDPFMQIIKKQTITNQKTLVQNESLIIPKNIINKLMRIEAVMGSVCYGVNISVEFYRDYIKITKDTINSMNNNPVVFLPIYYYLSQKYKYEAEKIKS